LLRAGKGTHKPKRAKTKVGNLKDSHTKRALSCRHRKIQSAAETRKRGDSQKKGPAHHQRESKGQGKGEKGHGFHYQGAVFDGGTNHENVVPIWAKFKGVLAEGAVEKPKGKNGRRLLP